MIQNRELRIAAAALLVMAFAGDATAQRSSFDVPGKAIASARVVGEPAHYETPRGFEKADFIVRATCSRTRSVSSDIVLSWGNALAGQVRVDITGYADGFSTGRFVTSGPLSASTRELLFLDGETAVNYYWRMLSRSGDGWVVRANGRFEAPTCLREPRPE